MSERGDDRPVGRTLSYLPDRTWLLVLVPGLALVFVLGLASVWFAPPGSQVAAWWPSSGVAVALALWTRPGLRWVVVAGVVLTVGLANLAGGRGGDVSLGFGLANGLEALTVAWFLGRGRPGPPRLHQTTDLWRLLAGTALGALVGGAGAGLTATLLDSGDLLVTARAVLASHAAAILILCPLVMLAPPPPTRIPRLEAVVQPLVLAAVLFAVFVDRDGLPISFLPMPVLAWGAARLGVRVATIELLVAGAATSVLTTSGYGPFPATVERLGLDPEMTGTLLQANLVAYALVSLPIALITAQSAAALVRARNSARMLEGVTAAANRTAIIGTGLDSTITFFNTGAENLLGYSATELVGRRTPEVFHDADELRERAEALSLPPGLRVVGASLEKGATSEQQDWIWYHRDGRRMTVALRVSHRYDDHGRVMGWLGVAEDVTEERRGADVLRAALEREREAVHRLAQLDQTKSDFVASVSHELRTPITSVMGNLELVLDGDAGPLAPAQQAMLERVDRNARRLLGLIEDLLTLSRVEAGTFRVRVRPTDVRGVVERAVEALEGQRASSGVGLRVSVPEDQPVVVEGDADQLERAVTNLVSNGLKFTSAGGEVAVALEPNEAGAVLTVSDSGVGILPGDRDQVFERFFRSESAMRGAVPGTGLGLSIARAIVTGHGGSIEVDSTPGEGTTFTLHLPRTPPDPDPALEGAGPG